MILRKQKGFLFAWEIFDWADSLVSALVAVLITLAFIGRITVVDGISMLPTLVDRELLIISNLFYKPARNDIVVLYADKLINKDTKELGELIVKRVVGLPGDKIHIDFDEGIVYRNGTALPLTDVSGKIIEDGHMINDYTNNQIDMPEEFIVPENCVFVMGDNRNNSTDSRDVRVSAVDERNIIGKAYFRIFPLNKLGTLYD